MIVLPNPRRWGGLTAPPSLSVQSMTRSASALRDQAVLPARHAGRMVMQKPYTLAMMSRSLASLLEARD